MTTAIIRKDTFNSATRCWTADLHHTINKMGEPVKWTSWAYGFKSMKTLVQFIKAVDTDIEILRDKSQDL